MSYLQNIAAFHGDNLGSLLEIWVVSLVDVESLPPLQDGVRYGDIVLKSGKYFVTWEVTKDTPRSKAAGQSSFDGDSETDTLSFVIPKDQPGIRNMLNLAREDELLIVYKDANGQMKGFGSLEDPVRFKYNFDSGASISDRNAYTCEFYSEGLANTWFYDGTVAVAPPGALPALVKRSDGVILAQLAPGQSFVLTSGFSFGFRIE